MRLPPLNPDEMSPEMRREWDTITSFAPATGGIIGGPFDPWLRSPELCHRLLRLGRAVKERTSLERGLLEYAIAVTNRHWACNSDWLYHCAEAVRYGIEPAVLENLLSGVPPSERYPDLRLVFDVVTALLTGHPLGDALCKAAVERFGERGLVELTVIAGYYTVDAFTLRAFEVEPAPGLDRPFPRPPEAPAASADVARPT